MKAIAGYSLLGFMFFVGLIGITMDYGAVGLVAALLLPFIPLVYFAILFFTLHLGMVTYVITIILLILTLVIPAE